jgi:outer membrane protein OmpA-like peptidoglycan-associated protein
MNELKWYKNGTRLEGESSTRLSVTSPGNYRAVWKNCVGDSVYMDKSIGSSVEEKDVTSLDYQIEHSDKFILNNLQFDVQSAVLLEPSKKELDKLAKILNDRPTIKIRLEGHTDVIGSAKLNQKLSEQRVISAKKYLIQKGISGSRIATQGFGGTRPISSGTSEEERRKNRRVEIVILSR